MLLRELKIVLRKLQQEINYTLINLIGLVIGISFSFLIYDFLRVQLSYDQHIPYADQIYRISSDFVINGHRDIYANSPRPMAHSLQQEYPGVLAATKITGFNGLTIHTGYLQTGEKEILCERLFVADSNFLKVFEIPMISGGHHALQHPNTAIVSETMALKLFNSMEVIGNKIELEDQSQVEITGVFKDHEQPTFLDFEVIVSYTTFFSDEQGESYWYGGHVMTYIRTVPGFHPDDIYLSWDPFYTKYMKPTFDELNGKATIIIQPIKELYLWEPYIWEPFPHGKKEELVIFASIGLFLLLVGCFNYMNLTLSQSYQRQREVGVRKVLGASAAELMKNRALEALVIGWSASLLAISLLSAFNPVVTSISSSVAPINFVERPVSIVIIFGIGTICGLVSSLYPALVESQFRWSHTKKELPKKGHVEIRKLFVLGQQMIAVILIGSTLVVVDQINFVKDRDLGFEPDNLVIIPVKERQLRRNIEAFTNALRQESSIESVTLMDESPKSGLNEFTYMMQDAEGQYISIPSQTIGIGKDFIKTTQLELLAGRQLAERDTFYIGVIINRFLAEKMGYTPEESIGARLKFGESDDVVRKVIGVVEDFSMSSARVQQQAMTLGYSPGTVRLILARISKSNFQQTLARIEEISQNHGANLPFSYSLFQTEMNDMLKNENRLYQLLILGSFLIIFIACLGLLGLIAHAANRRTKEIGMRKVLGADMPDLFWVLVKEFVFTYCWAFLIGGIIAWLFASNWLEEYAYRVSFDWGNLIIAGIAGFVIVLFTLGVHTLKVIKANPIKSLRYE